MANPSGRASGSIVRSVLTMIAIGVLAVTAIEAAQSRGGRPGDRGGNQQQNPQAPEAAAAFDGFTNGFVSQAQFDLDLGTFAEKEEIDEGLGPLFNSSSCGECHSNPIVGGISQITEVRAGKMNQDRFVDHAGGSLINGRAIDPSIQERVSGQDDVVTFRTSLNVLGDGFVEAIADSTLEAIASHQPAGVRGTIIRVPVLEANGALRIGRFGWKNQHASLVSFSADAYLNEMGITSPLQPVENTADGNSIAAYDDVPDPEEQGTPAEPAGPDIEAFARFMRATKTPPRDLDAAATADAREGEKFFTSVGCAQCHVTSIVTAAVGTLINGGRFTVPAALGNKTIHPFSDFLLHDVGTGDGIVQNGGPGTRNKLRTPPLWGLRTRSAFMHDGMSLTIKDAIQRHAGQAAATTERFTRLNDTQKRQLVDFLDSL